MRKFWTDIGFVLAVEQPTLGIMETDWAENRAEMPSDVLRRHDRQVPRRLLHDATSATSSARASSAAPSPAPSRSTFRIAAWSRCRRRKIDNRRRPRSRGRCMPPDPGLEAEMLDAADDAVRRARAQTAARGRRRPRPAPPPDPSARASRRKPTAPIKLVVDDGFDRAWRRVGLALDRAGFTVVDRDRSQRHRTSFAMPIRTPTCAKKDKGWLDKLMFWKPDEKECPSSTGSWSRRPRSAVSSACRTRTARPTRRATGEKILALLQDQLK